MHNKLIKSLNFLDRYAKYNKYLTMIEVFIYQRGTLYINQNYENRHRKSITRILSDSTP